MVDRVQLKRLVSHPVFLILLGATFLMVPPLLNGFPFIFPDSTDYLTLKPYVHRQPFYGLLIHFFHWNTFIWPPIAMQCVVVSQLLWLLMDLTSGRPSARIFLPFMAAMTALTSLPFFTGFLIADIFTPVMFLTYCILCFYHRKLSPWMLYYIFLLACMATAMHISNLSLGFGLCLVLMTLLALKRIPWRESKHCLALIGTPILLTITAILLFNGIIFKIWSIAPAGQSFFMANMIEYGPAREYLDEACPTIHYRICKFRPLPETANDLLWDDNSVYYRLGSFVGMKDESAAIVHETLRTHPHAVAMMIWHNFLRGLVNHTPAAEFYARYQIQGFKDLLQKNFGDDTLAEYKASAEMHDKIPHETLEAIDSIVTPLSFALLVIIALANLQSRPTSFNLAVATLCFVLGDTLLCTALSGVFDRYQSRVAWLLPMVLGLLLIAYLKKRRANA